jgi:hypothetical protein
MQGEYELGRLMKGNYLEFFFRGRRSSNIRDIWYCSSVTIALEIIIALGDLFHDTHQSPLGIRADKL